MYWAGGARGERARGDEDEGRGERRARRRGRVRESIFVILRARGMGWRERP